MTTLRNLLIALALLLAVPADAANKFLVLCTTACTWDNTNDAIWSTSSGGINNTTHPTSADTATADASSCVGGLTCTITIGADIVAQSVTWGACTASTTGCIIDNSANHSFTLSCTAGVCFSGSGTGTRTWTGGTGVFNISGTTGTLWTMTTVTGLSNPTTAFASTTINLTGGTVSSKTFAGGGLTYGTLAIPAGTLASLGAFTITGTTNTFTTLSISAPNFIFLPPSTTTTISNALVVTGTSVNQVSFASSNNGTTATMALAGGSSFSWTAFRDMTFTGSPTTTNSFDQGHNSGITINVPVTGGGRIIGG